MKAAGAAKSLMTLSTLSTFAIEEVMAVATGPVWFQLYVLKDRAISASLVRRAEVAGCKAEMVRQEFDLAMALSGCPTLSSITRDLIRRS